MDDGIRKRDGGIVLVLTALITLHILFWDRASHTRSILQSSTRAYTRSGARTIFFFFLMQVGPTDLHYSEGACKPPVEQCSVRRTLFFIFFVFEPLSQMIELFVQGPVLQVLH